MEHDEDWKPFLVVPGNPDTRKFLEKDLKHSISGIEAMKPEAEPVYGLPDKKKYPMPDRNHVLSAIRFFNYVDPQDEERLAKAILKRMGELNITGVTVGEVNRFKKYYDRSTTLEHHGIKGMKWGVWNEETRARHKYYGKPTKYYKKGGILPKGSMVSRINQDIEDKHYDNKKYISTTLNDNYKWEKYLGQAYRKRGSDTFNIYYKTNNDLRVASDKDLKQVYRKQVLNNPEKIARAKIETKQSAEWMHKPLKKYNSTKSAGMNIALQTQTGKDLVKALRESGYDAFSDKHGRNIAKDPLVVIDPDKNLTKYRYEKTKY